jgi:hypothetical protein
VQASPPISSEDPCGSLRDSGRAAELPWDLRGEQHSFRGFYRDASGNEFLSMEMTATRR